MRKFHTLVSLAALAAMAPGCAATNMDDPASAGSGGAWLSGAECHAKMQASADVSKVLDGYWVNESDTRIGKWSLSSVNFFPDFDGTEPARVSIDFEDMTSAELQGELGPYRENNDRVEVDACRFDGSSVVMKGTGKQTGAVELTGKFDMAKLASSNAQDTGSETAILKGTLTIGNMAKPVTLGYWIGD